MNGHRKTVIGFFFVVASLPLAVYSAPFSPALPRLLSTCQRQAEPTQLAPTDLLDEARTKVGEGDYESAAKLLQQYLILEPGDRTARVELARVYSWDARYPESLAVYDKLLLDSAFDSDLGVERAQVMGWMGQYPDAEAAIRGILALEPEHLEANLLLASLLEWQGKTEESQQVYQWVIKLDPSRQQEGSETPEPTAPSQGREWMLRFHNEYSGDINGFTRFSSRLGLRIPVFPVISLTPFAHATVMDEKDQAALWGAGGGLAIDWQVVERLSMGVEGSGLFYPDLPEQVDWRGAFAVTAAPAEWLYLSLRLHTELYGELGQSMAALTGGVRSWGGDLSAYTALGRFEAFALLTLQSVDRPGYASSLVTTGLFSPKVRLFGEKHRFYLGYKLWFTGHSEAAPLIYNYWSPARYFTHHLMVHLAGPVGAGSYFVEAGGGLGHEYEPASGVGSATPQDARWAFFPVAVGGAGLRLPLAPRVELETGGWTTFSRRIDGPTDSQYVLWFVEANLNFRW
jgi:tetratricopeptide (TPR) repeat protein